MKRYYLDIINRIRQEYYDTCVEIRKIYDKSLPVQKRLDAKHRKENLRASFEDDTDSLERLMDDMDNNTDTLIDMIKVIEKELSKKNQLK